MRELFAYRI